MSDKIDFVITWVDGNDPEWQKEKNKYNKAEKDDTNSTIRYRDWGLMKYWFRGVEKYAPWVNNVFFITCGQLPEWINLENPKLKFIKHSDYMPKEALPTFNSRAIELCMNNIQELEEKFVYFNDDMFLTSKVRPSDFYENDRPKDALIFNAISIKDKNNNLEHAILNDLEMIAKFVNKKDIPKNQFFNLKYGVGNIRNLLLYPWKYYTGIYNPHVPISHLKSTFNELWDKQYEELLDTVKSKFRSKNDYNHWVFRYYNLVTGNFVPYKISQFKYWSLENDNAKFVNDVTKRKI